MIKTPRFLKTINNRNKEMSQAGNPTELTKLKDPLIKTPHHFN